MKAQFFQELCPNLPMSVSHWLASCEHNMAKILIDANIYLTAYESKGHSMTSLLKNLLNIKDSVFVCQQIVNEVYRRKLEVFLDCTEKSLQPIQIHKSSLPSHISGKDYTSKSGLTEKLGALSELAQGLESYMADALSKVSKSQDEISLVLNSLFENAVTPSDAEMRAARSRREVGNPPGKANNPLGDQIIWEQFLNSIKGEDRIWIISKDSDYLSEYRNSFYLNSQLHSEVMQINQNAEIFCFKALSLGLKHYFKINPSLPSPPSDELILQAAKEEAEAQNSNSGFGAFCYICKSVQPCTSMKIPSASHDVITLHQRCNRCGNLYDSGML